MNTQGNICADIWANNLGNIQTFIQHTNTNIHLNALLNALVKDAYANTHMNMYVRWKIHANIHHMNTPAQRNAKYEHGALTARHFAKNLGAIISFSVYNSPAKWGMASLMQLFHLCCSSVPLAELCLARNDAHECPVRDSPRTQTLSWKQGPWLVEEELPAPPLTLDFPSLSEPARSTS